MVKSLLSLRVPFVPLLITFTLGALVGAFLFGNGTPLARAGGTSAPTKATPTVSKKINADQVDNVHAAKTPAANKLLALDGNAKFPDAALPNTISRTTHNHFGQTWTASAAVGLSVTNTSPSGTSFSVVGTNTNGDGVKGASTNHNGMYGTSAAALASGVYGENTGGGYGVAGRVTNGGWAMLADGNVTQTRDKDGWIKAALRVGKGGGISKCFNSQIAPNSGAISCGFTVSYHDTNLYDINFGFEVDDRYWVASDASGGMVTAIALAPNQLQVRSYDVGGTADHSDFFVIVY